MLELLIEKNSYTQMIKCEHGALKYSHQTWILHILFAKLMRFYGQFRFCKYAVTYQCINAIWYETRQGRFDTVLDYQRLEWEVIIIDMHLRITFVTFLYCITLSGYNTRIRGYLLRYLIKACHKNMHSWISKLVFYVMNEDQTLFFLPIDISLHVTLQ